MAPMVRARAAAAAHFCSVGDVILEVMGMKTISMTHEEISAALRSRVSEVRVVIQPAGFVPQASKANAAAEQPTYDEIDDALPAIPAHAANSEYSSVVMAAEQDDGTAYG